MIRFVMDDSVDDVENDVGVGNPQEGNPVE